MHREIVRLPADTQPILTVVVHTEEEFDWGKPHDRNATGVEHMRHIGRAQAVFDEFGIVPNYVVDYPIATQRIAIEPLKSFADSRRALIGAHLHPWVSPPELEQQLAATLAAQPPEPEKETLEIDDETAGSGDQV